MIDAAEAVHAKFVAAVRTGDLPPVGTDRAGLGREAIARLFHSQATSRQLDRLSRRLQARGEGFYTIGSSGHEGNAAIAHAARVTDMAFLHYRSAAFQIERSHQLDGETPAWDMLLSFVASSEDPIAAGRHKVLGSKRLTIPPQTSTIASHLPKAIGAAFALGLARRNRVQTDIPLDSVIIASFGDASANHSTAQGAFNTAGWAAHQGTPMPIVFVCEDNGIGISTKTPRGWIETQFRNRAGLHYIACDGSDLVDAYRGARAAIDHARRTRRPVFLHMSTVRLYGHAGSDVQGVYRPRAEIEAEEARDPLLTTAALLIADGVPADEVLAIYDGLETTLARAAEAAIRRPKLATSADVMASIVPSKANNPSFPRRRESILAERSDSHLGQPQLIPASAGMTVFGATIPTPEARTALFAKDAGQFDKPQHMARLLSWTLADILLAYPNAIVAGEDVGRKGGVYNVTARLHERFGPSRVVDTLLDEQSILGLAIGAAQIGLLPIPEIQFLAYVHNAEDQIRGEAATLSFFSNGQYTNPMVIRIAGLPYQKGFGGHFHNDNSLAVFRDLPGVVLAVPSNGADAVAMLRECVRLADEESRVVVFVEPIALYMTRDLHAEGDGLMTATYTTPADTPPIRLGQVGVHGDGDALAIVTYGNGAFLSRQALPILAEAGIAARVIDLRWLAPLPAESLLAAIGDTARVLIVDECRSTGSQSEALMAFFVEQAPDKDVARIVADDSFIPLGKGATLTLPSRDGIVAAAKALVAPPSLTGRGRGWVDTRDTAPQAQPHPYHPDPPHPQRLSDREGGK